MDQITKTLQKLSPKEREQIKALFLKIKQGDFENCDLKKLKGHADIFRVRKGDFRVLFSKKNEEIRLLRLERRSDQTYRNV